MPTKYGRQMGTGVYGTTKSLYHAARGKGLYPGERHALLKLPGNKFARAQFMGPGTKIVERLRAGSIPLTESDVVSQAHDIRYALATTPADIRIADQKMIAKLKEAERLGKDSKFNTKQGLAGIAGKIAMEDVGLFKEGSFGDLDKPKTYSVPDHYLLKNKLARMEQRGYGLCGSKVCGSNRVERITTPAHRTPGPPLYAGPAESDSYAQSDGIYPSDINSFDLEEPRSSEKAKEDEGIEEGLGANDPDQAGTGKYVNKMVDGRMQTVYEKSLFEKLADPANKALMELLKKGAKSIFGMKGSGQDEEKKQVTALAHVIFNDLRQKQGSGKCVSEVECEEEIGEAPVAAGPRLANRRVDRPADYARAIKANIKLKFNQDELLKKADKKLKDKNLDKKMRKYLLNKVALLKDAISDNDKETEIRYRKAITNTLAEIEKEEEEGAGAGPEEKEEEGDGANDAQAGKGKYVNKMVDGRMQTVYEKSLFEKLADPANKALMELLKKGAKSIFGMKGSGNCGSEVECEEEKEFQKNLKRWKKEMIEATKKTNADPDVIALRDLVKTGHVKEKDANQLIGSLKQLIFSDVAPEDNNMKLIRLSIKELLKKPEPEGAGAGPEPEGAGAGPDPGAGRRVKRPRGRPRKSGILKGKDAKKAKAKINKIRKLKKAGKMLPVGSNYKDSSEKNILAEINKILKY